MREKPLDREMEPWIRHHLGDKHCFAPFTGTDWPAWRAFCYLLRCYGTCGADSVIEAMRATVATAQKTLAVRQIFCQTIPGVLDWGYVRQIWPRLVDGDDQMIWAIERAFDGTRVWKHGLHAPAVAVIVPIS